MSWRLIHDGQEVLALLLTEGITTTSSSLYEAASRDECLREISRLGLSTARIELSEADQKVLKQPTSVPDEVPAWQAKRALGIYGHLLDIETYIGEMTGPEGALARNDWYSATMWRRDWPLVLAMQQQMGWTDAYVDRLFITASNL
jgi:hypothetical protein